MPLVISCSASESKRRKAIVTDGLISAWKVLTLLFGIICPRDLCSLSAVWHIAPYPTIRFVKTLDIPLSTFCNLHNYSFLQISAKQGTNISQLEQAIYDAADIPTLTDTDVIITNARHYEALLRARQSLSRVLDGLRSGLSGDLLSEDLRDVLSILSEITGGQITTPEVLGNIFKNFCVGK